MNAPPLKPKDLYDATRGDVQASRLACRDHRGTSRTPCGTDCRTGPHRLRSCSMLCKPPSISTMPKAGDAARMGGMTQTGIPGAEIWRHRGTPQSGEASLRNVDHREVPRLQPAFVHHIRSPISRCANLATSADPVIALARDMEKEEAAVRGTASAFAVGSSRTSVEFAEASINAVGMQRSAVSGSWSPS